MTTNTSKFTGVQPVETDKTVSTTTETPVTRMGKVFAALALCVGSLFGICQPAAAAYTSTQSPVALSCLTTQAPDLLAMNGDFFVWALNLCVQHPLLLAMFFLAVMMIVFGAITGLFRRGKRRGR